LAEADVLDELVTASLSDVGRSRSENQDAWREASNALGERLLVLADGMGGHRGGAEASRMCVETIEQRFLEQHDPVEVRLRRGIGEANADILRRGLEDSDLGGMGATCVALVLAPDGQGWVAWAGDSRLYRLRAGVLEQLTDDHSLVSEWQKLGVLTPAQAANHPKRNELTRAIGVTREVEPELRALEIEPGDRYLLCSDGLSSVVDPATVQQLLGVHPPTAAAQNLIDCANARGGPDNVTVQIAWLPDGSPPPLHAAEAIAPEPEREPEIGVLASPIGTPAEPSFELPVRPLPLPPLVPRAPARAEDFVDAEPAAQRSPPPLRPRPPRVRIPPRHPLHAPSLVVGILIGLALASAASGYLRWRESGASVEAPRAIERQPEKARPVEPPAAQAHPVPQASAPAPPAPPSRPAAARAPAARTAPVPEQRPASPEPPPREGGIRVVGEVPEGGRVRWVPVSEPVPTSAEFPLPAAVHAFLDAWLAALSADDAAAHAALGFRTGAAEFARVQASRESYRLLEVEVSPRSTRAQTYLRVRLSYAFQNGSGRFRTEDELRLILEPTAAGLRFAGHWQE
jgi:protein phosphatase